MYKHTKVQVNVKNIFKKYLQQTFLKISCIFKKLLKASCTSVNFIFSANKLVYILTYIIVKWKPDVPI